MDDLSKEIVKETVNSVYNDVITPSAKPIGIMLSYLPRTIRLAFSKWEKWIINGERSLELTGELIREKIQNIPEEKLTEPEPYVAIPAIQQLTYSFDSQQLREMYANLLVSSMNSDKKKDVHPAFVELIRQLCPDEAKLLKRIYPMRALYPIIDVKSRNPKEGFHYIIRNFCFEEELEHFSKITQYLDNLERLKIIEITDLYVLDDKVYEELEKNEFVTRVIELCKEPENTIEFVRKSFMITDFGIEFLRVCVFEEKTSESNNT